MFELGWFGRLERQMRLFVAIPLDPGVKDELARIQRGLGQFDREVRWVRPEQMHLTLVFLGEVADDRVPGVCDAAKEAASRVGPFELRLCGSGCFPERGRARVVWVGLEEPTGGLVACHGAVADALAGIGFPRESRPFSPHLTLGRVRDDGTRGALRDAADAVSVTPVQQRVEAVRVVQSTLAPSGARYATVADCPLCG